MGIILGLMMAQYGKYVTLYDSSDSTCSGTPTAVYDLASLYSGLCLTTTGNGYELSCTESSIINTEFSDDDCMGSVLNTTSIPFPNCVQQSRREATNLDNIPENFRRHLEDTGDYLKGRCSLDNSMMSTMRESFQMRIYFTDACNSTSMDMYVKRETNTCYITSSGSEIIRTVGNTLATDSYTSDDCTGTPTTNEQIKGECEVDSSSFFPVAMELMKFPGEEPILNAGKTLKISILVVLLLGLLFSF